ncbi:hypothetical protein L596_020302 [Steinernema carpocapsae]|uniref:Uncharacterized protein n=1 Tax=Steinernema carpocapsae TaxID=34508 RepID=A0A4U5MTB5_STECR|nr:hypothetical protein L596_020302 [Steinernema carpocapsae]
MFLSSDVPMIRMSFDIVSLSPVFEMARKDIALSWSATDKGTSPSVNLKSSRKLVTITFEVNRGLKTP